MFLKSIFVVFIATILISCGGGSSSSSSTTNSNLPPTAIAGTVQSVTEGAIVMLDGGGSNDANGDPLTYTWLLISKPTGSNASLSSASAIKPSFVADLIGTYVASLIVNDGKVNSRESNVTITVLTAPPTTPILAFTIKGHDALQGNGMLIASSMYRSVSQYPNFWDFCSLVDLECRGSGASGVTPSSNLSGQSYVDLAALNINSNFFPVKLNTRSVAASIENGNIETGYFEFSAASEHLAKTLVDQASGFQMKRILNVIPSSTVGDVYTFSGVADTSAVLSGWLTETETAIDITANVHWYNTLGRPESMTVSIFSSAYHGNFSESVSLINNFDRISSIPKGSRGIFSISVTNRLIFKRK
jgi:hypothetical protein